MATNLSGSLSEFTLAEVLALLSMGRRTARMQVSSPTAVGVVNLVDGRVSSATADCSRASLLRSAVAALPIPTDDLAAAVCTDDPVRHLVDGGVVDRAEAQQVAQEQSTEAVAEMLGWESGEFAVSVGEVDSGDIGMRVEVDQLVAAAEDRAQVWADLRAALPAADSVLALVADVAQGPVVDAEDWAVLARIDGRRTLEEVLAAMGAAPLAAGHRLVDLMGRGLVSVRVGDADADSERANQLIDQFEVGAGAVVGSAVEAEVEAVEVVADEVPELLEVQADVPEPTELVVSQPMSLPGEVEHDVSPSVFAAEAQEPPMPVFEPVFEPAWEVEASGPVFVDPEPVAPVETEQVSFLDDPVASLDEAGAEFAWSPWAQEMGLSEGTSGNFQAAPAAEGTVEEDDFGSADTDAFPAPQAPQGMQPVSDSPEVFEVVQVGQCSACLGAGAAPARRRGRGAGVSRRGAGWVACPGAAGPRAAFAGGRGDQRRGAGLCR